MEEEKRVPNYNPKEDDKEYIGTKLLDGIERGASSWYKDERTLEGWEYLNPLSVATAGAIRGVEGVGWVLGNTPVAGDLLRGIGWAEDRLAEGARNISGALTPDLDPRFAGWGTRLGTAILADKGIRKAAGATKATLREGAERAAVRSGKKYTSTRPETMSNVWNDDLAGPRKTYERTNKKRYYPENPPADPWLKDDLINDIDLGELQFSDNNFDDFMRLQTNMNPVRRMTPIDDVSPSGYSYRKQRGLPEKDPFWNNLPEKTQKLFTEAGMDNDQARFFVEKWNEKVPRETSASLEGFPFTDRTFDFMSEEMLPKILEDMKGVNLTNGLQVDHIAQLRAILPFYYNKNLIESAKVRRILIKEGIFGGHHPRNLKYLPTDVHTVKTNFWTNQVGDYGEKFFKGRKLNTNEEIRKAAKEMKEFIDRSNDVVEKLSAQYYLMNKKVISAEDLDRILKKVDLNYGTYNLKTVRALIREISTDTLAKSKKGLDEAKEAAEAVEFKEKKALLPYEIEDVDPADLPKKKRVTKKKPTLQQMAEKAKKKEEKRKKKLGGQQELNTD